MSDKNKVKYRGIPANVLLEVATVITEGDKKHGEGSWKGKSELDFYDALMRHIEAWRMGVTEDEDDGMHPLSHAIVNCIYIMGIEERERKTVNAFKYPEL